jgi:hypothetical protein
VKSLMPGEHIGGDEYAFATRAYAAGALSFDEVATDHGPRKTHSADEEWAKDLKPDVREAMRRNAWDRDGGINVGSTDGLVMVERQKRSDAEEDYLNALHGAFRPAIARLTETQQLYLHGLMQGRSTRHDADLLGVKQQSVQEGRQTALNALAKVLGASGKDDKPGIRRGLVAGTNFPLTEWLPGFTEGSTNE